MVKSHQYRTSRYEDAGGFVIGTIADVEFKFEFEFEDTQVAHTPKMVMTPVSRTRCRYLQDPGRIRWGPGHGN